MFPLVIIRYIIIKKTSSNFKCSFTIHYSHEAYQWYQSTNSELFGYVCASRNVVHVYTGLCVALTLCVELGCDAMLSYAKVLLHIDNTYVYKMCIINFTFIEKLYRCM